MKPTSVTSISMQWREVIHLPHIINPTWESASTSECAVNVNMQIMCLYGNKSAEMSMYQHITLNLHCWHHLGWGCVLEAILGMSVWIYGAATEAGILSDCCGLNNQHQLCLKLVHPNAEKRWALANSECSDHISQTTWILQGNSVLLFMQPGWNQTWNTALFSRALGITPILTDWRVLRGEQKKIQGLERGEKQLKIVPEMISLRYFHGSQHHCTCHNL